MGIISPDEDADMVYCANTEHAFACLEASNTSSVAATSFLSVLAMLVSAALSDVGRRSDG
jgi:hypothetical protein